ncbi:MAG: gamma-glutamyltransferase [Gemmataceae bacterium]|nr:gamma-glutamyltransferase [Gemmataceae bacterium]
MTLRCTFIFLACLAGAALPAGAAGQPVEFKQGVVVSVSQPASEAGLAILKKGGNAVDAAVATAFALAVTHPAAGNIGGGGFMVVHPPSGKPLVFDYRETAPAAAHQLMFRKDESPYRHQMAGVPGTVRGMALAHQRLGKLPWKTLLTPAVRLGEEGFVLDKHHAESLNKVVAAAKDFAELRRVFGRADGTPWRPGDRLVQPDLARTLRLIAEKGPDTFYAGSVADLIVAEMKAGGGLITRDDLASYQAVERQPIHGVYRGYDVYAPPPPSSGGICLVQMLNVLENFDLKKHERFSAPTLHLMAEAMRRAYCDRARFLGDPAFVKTPPHLTTKEYAKKLAGEIDLRKATTSADLAKDLPLAAEGESTTHFSVIDKDGLAVANTYTLEHSYGARVVVKGAGFLLNNEMMDFNKRPGVTDRKGTIGTDPNLIAPGKRMLSSMTPTIVAKDGKVVLITGSPGGRTIINTVLSVVVNVIDYEMPIQEAVDAPRLHHQWFPDELRLERMNDYPATVAGLKDLGHRVLKAANAAKAPKQGDAHSIWINPQTGGYVGAADKRLSGYVAGY